MTNRSRSTTNNRYCSNCSDVSDGRPYRVKRETVWWTRPNGMPIFFGDRHEDDVRHEWTYFYCSNECMDEHASYLARAN